MDHTDHNNCSCTVKSLPPEQLISASSRAIEINPLNAPVTQALRSIMPGLALKPEHLAVLTSKYWGSKGVRLTVGFLDNPAADLKARILSHMNSWGKWSNVQFLETAVSPQVRIARLAGDGYWSYLGTDVNLISAEQPTMNLDSFTMNTPDSEFYRVVRHETGHTLGFPHEHMRSDIINRIDQNKAIAHFGQTQGWSKQEVIDQVLTPLDPGTLIATPQADVNSIMCYWLPASIMKDGVAVPGGNDINAQDATFAAQIYPVAVSPSSIWPNGKAYFFKGAQYLRYDPATDKTDAGYPKPIAGNWPGFPAGFATGVNAGVIWNNGKAYFFKGNKYIRYDIAADKTDAGYPKPIAGNWPGLWTDNIDAVIVWPNSKAYFFKGSQYIRYDLATGKADIGYPKNISSSWPGFPADFAAGVNAAVVWNNGKAYFFKGSQYIRYDIAADKTDAGYPKPIAGNWAGFWADNIDA
jgi:Hemopexin/Astacin (Peptidase family M12A)